MLGATPLLSAHTGSRAKRRASTGFIYASVELTQTAGAVNWYPVGTDGNVPPTGSISGSQTQLSHVNGIAVDAAGEIYVANGDTSTIVGFAPNSTGNVAPNIEIVGTQTRLDGPADVAVDASGNLWVTNAGLESEPSIEEFAAGSNGDSKPTRRIAGPRTLLKLPNGIAFYSTGDVYVADRGANAILMFRPTQRGDAAPKRIIAGKRTKIDTPNGIAVSDKGVYLGSGVRPFFEQFAPDEKGDRRPVALVEGSATQLECCTNGLAAAPDETVYVVWGSGGGGISQYAATADGNAAPLSTIYGPASQISGVVFVAITN